MMNQFDKVRGTICSEFHQVGSMLSQGLARAKFPLRRNLPSNCGLRSRADGGASRPRSLRRLQALGVDRATACVGYTVLTTANRGPARPRKLSGSCSSNSCRETDSTPTTTALSVRDPRLPSPYRQNRRLIHLNDLCRPKRPGPGCRRSGERPFSCWVGSH